MSVEMTAWCPHGLSVQTVEGRAILDLELVGKVSGA